MRVDKRTTEMLSSCPDLVNLRPGRHYTENCIRCFSGCYAAKDTWAFSVLVFLLNFFLLLHFFLFLFLFLLPFFLILTFTFSFPSCLFPFLFLFLFLSFFFPSFPSRNQEEMDAAPIFNQNT